MRLKHFLSVFLTLLTLSVGQMWGASTTKSVSIGTYATSQSWADQSKHTSIPIDDYVTASVSNGSNTGKYYSSDNTWRLYANESATLTISTTSGTISSVTLNFSIKDNGTIKYGNNACTSGTAKSVSGNSVSFTVGSSSGTKGKVFITSISVTYTPATPSYSISASSNDNSWGTVSVDGSTITASPTDCYQVVSGTGGYNVVSGTYSSITHTGNSNTISVTPTSNCSIQVVFEKKTVNTYIDDIQDNGTIEDCSTTAPTLTNKTAATTGTCAQQHWHFVGWVPEAYKATPKGHITNGGSTITVNGTTYYAVWSKGSGGSITLSQSDLTTGITNSYGSGSVTKGDYTFNTYGCKQSSKLQMRNSDSYVQIPTLPGTITGISSTACYNTSDGNYTGTLRLKSAFAAGNTTTNDIVTKELSNVGNFSWSISTTASAGYLVTSAGLRLGNLTITYGTYSDSIAVCCTPLGTINGSFS